MTRITANIGGIACGMCEAHINDAVRRAFPVKKVTSSHTKKQTIIIAEAIYNRAISTSSQRVQISVSPES